MHRVNKFIQPMVHQHTVDAQQSEQIAWCDHVLCKSGVKIAGTTTSCQLIDACDKPVDIVTQVVDLIH